MGYESRVRVWDCGKVGGLRIVCERVLVGHGSLFFAEEEIKCCLCKE